MACVPHRKRSVVGVAAMSVRSVPSAVFVPSGGRATSETMSAHWPITTRIALEPNVGFRGTAEVAEVSQK